MSFAEGFVTRLRAVREDDAAALFETFKDRRTFLMLHGSIPVGYGVSDIEKMIAPSISANITWIIETMDDCSVAGYVQTDCSRVWHGSFSVTVAVAPRFQGKRVGLDARIAHINYLFRQLNARRVVGYYRADNVAAERMNRKLGATTCGRLKDRHFNDGSFADLIPYSYSAEMFFAAVGADLDIARQMIHG